MRGEITKQQCATLVGLSAARISKLTEPGKHRNGKSLYQGHNKGGRPQYYTEEDKKRFLLQHAAMRETRKTKGDDAVFKICQSVQKESLQSRGYSLPVGFTSRPFGKTWFSNLMDEVGLGSRSYQSDNPRRVQALEAPRNAISTYAGLLGISDPRWTCDNLPVALCNRHNFDAVTVFERKQGGKVITVVQWTALTEDDAELKR